MADWTDAAIDRLRTLWNEGHSSGRIAKTMGISKNSVVGKAHRLDLSRRPSPIKLNPAAPKPLFRPKRTLPTAATEFRAPKRIQPQGEWCEPAPAVHVRKGGRAAVVATLEVPPKVAPPAFTPPLTFSARCTFPLWPHGTRPKVGEHRYCDAPVTTKSCGRLPSSCCATHHAVCFTSHAAYGYAAPVAERAA